MEELGSRLLLGGLADLFRLVWLGARALAHTGWRWTRLGAAALWRSLRPYGTASWRHPPRGA